MKKIIFISLLIATMFSQCSDITSNNPSDCNSSGDSKENSNVNNLNCTKESPLVIVSEGMEPEDVHEYVDLELPSGLLWSTCNVGASNPEEFGDLFAWGETNTKDIYTHSTYKWNENTDVNPYEDRTDGIQVCMQSEDDAASVNWGIYWRIPTDEEMRELYEQCSWEWTSDYKGTGVAGKIGKSRKNGKTIFFPAAGFADSISREINVNGHYMTGILPICYSFGKDKIESDNHFREYGISVRPVKQNKLKVTTFIETDVDSYLQSSAHNIKSIDELDEIDPKPAGYISSDAKLHNVRGNVKKVIEYHIETDSSFIYDLTKVGFDYTTERCVFESCGNLNMKIFTFDSNGKAVYLKLFEDGNQIECKEKRNGKDQLLEFELDNKYMGCGATVYFSYKSNGLLDSMYYYGYIGKTSVFKYDKNQHTTYSQNHWEGSSNTSGDEYRYYKTIKVDRYGNWIKRHITTKAILREEGSPAIVRKEYEAEYRKIEYAE